MSVGVKGIVAQARRAAQKRGQRPTTAHLLLVMLQQGGDVSKLLGAQGIQEAALLGALRNVDPEAASAFERALERSVRLATQLGDPSPSALHLLLAITRDARSAGHRSLARLGTGPARVHDEVLSRLGVTGETRVRQRRPLPPPRAPRRTARPEPRKEARRTAKPRRPSARRDPSRAPAVLPPSPPAAPLGPLELTPERFPMLSKLGRDLTAVAKAGELDPVIGRAHEIERVLDVLARRRANNPVLVGPPGVGKTAIVEGVAQALAEGVAGLESRLLVELSAGALVSGTGIRGALADRMRIIREEVKSAQGRLILFIDEIHSVVGGGEGPDDLAHELKAALARGELPCIGATTDAEYHRHFERDPALVRRFSPVSVGEPDAATTVSILAGVVPRYAAHHGVRYEEDALESAVSLSVRFVPDRHLPDKAIGVLDLAAARTRRRGGRVVDRAAVAAVVAEMAHIPSERLLMEDGERLLTLESHLAARVVGHQDAIARIADALRKSAAGLGGGARPMGTFLFLGPTGVGKTETAKAIGEVFFPGSPMTRIDMSELGQAHAVARMVGAPPGYVGHDEGGQLTEAVRRRPYQLLLLDEIEKAHPEVLVSLLPLLDEGRLTDGRGRTVDFTNTIIVMTSNLGAEAATQRSIGFGTEKEQCSGAARALGAVRAALPPELFNRIDEPLYFGPLCENEVREIATRMLAGVAQRLAESAGIRVDFDESVAGTLMRAGGYDPTLGARPMRRVVGRLVEAPLAKAVVGGQLGRGDSVRLYGRGPQVVLDLGASNAGCPASS